MTKAPAVSILMPFLDAEAFIEEAVESVLAQTFTAWELLLIDDGSTDRSSAIARDYANRSPGAIVLLEHAQHRNRGMSASLNLGIRHARGRLLAMLDADDVWLPNKLEEQVPLLDAHPEAGMLYGNTVFWRSWSGLPEDVGRDAVPPLGVPVNTTVDPPAVLLRCLQRKAAVPCTCSVLMRREAVERVGGFEESFARMFSDQAFYTKMLLATPVYVADKVWDKYRIHTGSTVSVAKRAGVVREGRRVYLDFVNQYLEDHGLARGPLSRTVTRERWGSRHPRAEALVARSHRAAAKARRRVAALVPERWRPRLRRLIRPVGGARFGNLRRVAPVSRHFGLDRGRPVDRYYIEAFLLQHAADIRGRVLEIGDATYTRRFGGERVSTSDVLHVDAGNQLATIVDDLASGLRIPADAFDCVILTQTLHLLFDVRGAVRTVHRILKPGGVALVTVPGISQIDAGRWKHTWYWSFTPVSMQRLFDEQFDPSGAEVRSHGNVLAACAFLQGLAAEELSSAELEAHDASYPVVVTVRARKPPADPGPSSLWPTA
jgi:glycosyltransferase involved in cell wall biosynthesis